MLEAASGRNDGIANSAYGLFTSDGTATIINVGFIATHVLVCNETDNIVWEKVVSMGANNCIRRAAAAQTIDATNAIVIGSNNDQSVTISAAACGTGKAISWRLMR